MYPQDFTQQQLQALMAPLNGNRVSSRSQGGRSLSYLEAWDVKAALIRVFGFGNWSADVTESKILRMERDVPAFSGSGNSRTRKMNENGEPDFNWSVTAMVTLRLTIAMTGATYTETAIASQTGPDVGEVSDFAVKTAESDALKRCAINLGTQFGLGLYNNGGLGDVVRVLLDPRQKEILEGTAPQEKGAPEGPADPVEILKNQAGATEVPMEDRFDHS
jgi:recombination DNA repair RAD52 pathway protein